MKLRGVLARNLTRLGKDRGWANPTQIHRGTGVSQDTVRTITLEMRSATLDVIEKLACGLRVPPAALLIDDEDLVTLLQAYHRADPEGRALIAEVARRAVLSEGE